MSAKKSFILFMVLISLTFCIFFSTILLSKSFPFENKADAHSQFSTTSGNLSLKSTSFEYKMELSLGKQFLAKRNRPILYLTFDDGPTPYTDDILKTLNKYEVKATFFMLNDNIIRYPEIVKDISESGHSIGCHGVTHSLKKFYKTKWSPLKEMETCSKTVKKYTGQDTKIARTPYGSHPYLTSTQKKNLEKENYVLWDWNVDSLDWKSQSTKKMLKSIIKQVKNQNQKGNIPVILLHDKAITAKGLPKLIEELQELGFEFKTISPEDDPVHFR